MSRPARCSRVLVVCALLAALVPSAAAGSPPGPASEPGGRPGGDAAPAYVPGEVLVRFATGASNGPVAAAADSLGVRVLDESGVVDGLTRLAVPAGTTVAEAIASLEAMPGVIYAEPNYLVTPLAIPNDPDHPLQWGLHNTGQTVDGVTGTADADIDAPEAWDYATGSSSVVIAVVDSGVDPTHPDLVGSLWANAAEVAGTPGIDDDGNGVVDDLHGYDAADGDGDPSDELGHGTAVASVIAAQGDDASGMSGVMWDASVMPVRFIDGHGVGTIADAIAAFEYAHAMGADIINNSWGGWRVSSQAERDTIAAMSDTLFVCAAGNDGLSIDASWPGGITGGAYYGPRADWRFYPAAYDLGNVVTVAASDMDDEPAAFSNTGATAVDVFAPGATVRHATLPVATIAGDATENLLLAEPFDSLAAWWVFRWALDTSAFTSAPSSAARLAYPNNDIALLDQHSLLDLSASDHPVARFRAQHDLEAGGDRFVWGVYDPLATDPYPVLGSVSGTSAGFREFVCDLGPYAGRSDIYLWFGVYSNGSISSAEGYDGVWLDDVEVLDLDAGGSGSVWSRTYTGAYGYGSGTSMAAAHASGVAGLLLALDPALDAAQLKSALIGSVDAKPALTGLCASDGRVNAATALTAPIALGESVTAEGIAAQAAGAATIGIPIVVPAPGVLANDADPNGDPIEAVLVTGPVNGALDLSAAGGFTYTPQPGYFGADRFVYRVRDVGGALSAPVVASIVVANVAPVAADDAYVVRADRTLAVAAPGVLGNDVDAEMQPLTAAVVDPPASGVLDLRADGSFDYTPAAGFTGLVTFTYEAHDGVDPASAPATVSIDVYETQPVYRFYSPSAETHFYTADEAERAFVATALASRYVYEGVAYGVDCVTATVPLQRFYNRWNGTHFYTASAVEAARVITLYPGIYRYEGQTYPVSLSPQPGLMPVHRFYNRWNGAHFYTASEDERQAIIENWPITYAYEGVAFYVEHLPPAEG